MKNATYFAAHLQHCQRTPVKHGKVDHPKHLPASPWQSDNPSPTRRLNASLTSFPDPRPMSNYRRPRLSGRPIYFTTALAQRGSDLLLREIDLLRHAVRTTRADRPFHINAWVVLPDHMHCVWTRHEGDTDYSTRMGAIKARFSIALRRSGFTATLPNPNP